MAEIPSEIKDNIFEKIQKEVFHVKCINQLSDSIINYFCMAVGFFMLGCIHAEKLITISDDTLYFLYGNIFIAGIFLVVLGIYEWYKGRFIYILINFSFGLLFICWFIKNNLIDVEKDETYEGVFYILWAVLCFIIIIGVKNKAIIYSLDYLSVAAGFVFLFISKYADKIWIKYTYGWIFIVTGALFWITGLLRFINNSYLSHKFGLVRE